MYLCQDVQLAHYVFQSVDQLRRHGHLLQRSSHTGQMVLILWHCFGGCGHVKEAWSHIHHIWRWCDTVLWCMCDIKVGVVHSAAMVIWRVMNMSWCLFGFRLPSFINAIKVSLPNQYLFRVGHPYNRTITESFFTCSSAPTEEKCSPVGEKAVAIGGALCPWRV